jgi:hypothetical protein
MRLIIAGDRNMTNYLLLREKCDSILRNTDINNVTFISGGARGADKLGEMYARQQGKKPLVFEAKWREFGGAAGPMRNGKMARAATHLIAFLRPNSRGTRDMIRQAEMEGLKIRVIKI